ncbi:hypothetical protein BDA99DRAFT_565862 [Phascolomyces articulosus]|uniref:SET domain-containing protein n=1 Tax=Phascolomyces articulosus TaxID=60185 RepID=A0AAD5JN08_9FUNG|nr:hypothetical protein BDA99DRAFT_565862 [Phascolomyces articulosus]
MAATTITTAMDFISIHGHPSSTTTPTTPDEKHQEKNWLSICSFPGKGRGFVATQQIPAGTIVHTAEPLAAVVSQEWIPETCAWCFHFTYPKKMKYKMEMKVSTTCLQKKKKKQHPRSTTMTSKDVLFCSESCQQKYQTYGYHKNESELLLRCFHALEQVYHQRREKQTSNDNEDILHHDMNKFIKDLLHQKVDIHNDEQLRHWIDQAWTTFVQHYHQGQATQTWMPDDAERTMLRLVACCVGRRQMEAEYLFPELPVTVSTFNDLFQVQCNELAYIRRILLDVDHENESRKEKRILDALFDIMQMYIFFLSATSDFLDCPHTLFRAIYFREMANSFGLWEMASKQEEEDGNVTDDLELLGWGIYPSAVYFNHACDANIRKIRKGRQMVFISKRVIEQGEEACISYGCVEDTVQERRKRLLEHYHFLCACTRCEQEASSSSE